ncbi:hypothetical protein [Paraburkholderia sp. BL10I2N1]|uniref:hypothetical protein n=1 Tax=Paraburkholderia sp. BL10I2N1 TaxID=1938796 RepID=UPI00106022DA|nr:hypothetical protein [Paraburkholderia sp. BL10I2N1]TDN61423.1 hypothetical protein B0G77_4883 [Paraburkholderia sp. BL10I2N1]
MKRHPLLTARAVSLATRHRYPVWAVSAEHRGEVTRRALPTRRALVAVASAMLLGGCGGGNNNATTTSAQPVSVPLQAAFANQVDNGDTASFSVSGTIDSVPVTGSGTLTDSAPVVATFNDAAVLETKETITDIVLENGTPITVTETKEIFTNPETSAEVGQINDDGSVDVITQIDPIPISAPVGSSGVLGEGIEYSNSSEQTMVGTVEETYTVESGAASSGGSSMGSSGGSNTGSSLGFSTANCDVVDVVKEVKDKNKNRIRKSDKKTCVDDKGNSKFVSGEEHDRNNGHDDDFDENEQ